jgi:hypothetical protein
MPSPDEARPDSKPQDKAGSLGYNRDLIGAAQALRFDSAPANRSQLLSPIANRGVRKWRAIAGDGNRYKEVR